MLGMEAMKRLRWLVNSVAPRGLQSWCRTATDYGWGSAPITLWHKLDLMPTGMGHRQVSEETEWQSVANKNNESI